jgi:hypothetical protein
MDARITKQRLANMLSYDWLKIIGAIALAAVVFCVFFMMIATRATAGQTFYVYAYSGLAEGAEFSRLGDDLKARNVFAYDILDTGSETFSKNGYGNSVFMARRSTGEGRVMFVDDVRTESEDGKVSSTLLSFIEGEGTEQENFSIFLDPQAFLNDCENYLKNFFGEDLSEELNTEKARSAFMARNGKDKRYRTSAKKEAGVLQESERLKKLKDDFLAVKEAVRESLLSYVTYTGYGDKTHTLGFSMRQINKITSLVYYTAEEDGKKVQKKDDLVLCLFDNGTREGDLKYETVNFLAYLLRTYK